MNLGELLSQWLMLTSSRCRPATVQCYRSALNHVPEEMLVTEVTSVSPAMWEAALCACAAQYPRQAQLMHAALRKCWNDGQRLGLIPLDYTPYRNVLVPKHRPRPINYLLPEELSSYAAAAQATPAALPLLLVLPCGLRRGEAMGLKWLQIDERGMLMRIDSQLVNGHDAPPKSRTSDRLVPICAEILTIIKKFGDIDEKYCYNGGVDRLYAAHKAALAAAGINAHVTLHGLRHSCATAALASGADIKTVQRILGHATFAITADTYCHALLTSERRAIGALLTFASHAAATRLEIA